jgi:hypothetical protein
METADDKFRAGQGTVAFGFAYNQNGDWWILMTCEISHTFRGHWNIFNSPSFLSFTTSRRIGCMFIIIIIIIIIINTFLPCFTLLRRLFTYGRHLKIGGIRLHASHHYFV